MSEDELRTPPICNPVKLGIILSKCVFEYEVLKNTQAAIELANEIYELAMKEIDNLDDGADMQDIMSILGLLKENLDLWEDEKLKETGDLDY